MLEIHERNSVVISSVIDRSGDLFTTIEKNKVSYPVDDVERIQGLILHHIFLLTFL